NPATHGGEPFGQLYLAVADFGLNQGWTSATPRIVADVNGDGLLDIVGFGASMTFTDLGSADASGKLSWAPDSAATINDFVAAELAAELGLSGEEFERACAILGRTPNLTETGIIAAMWSEHCSYKSSKVWLRTLPTSGERVLCGPGENAGVIDIGDGDAVVFKIESHNHPSFIEPYQGAATGVGGILRDVFTMGARPIAMLNSLSFGSPDHKLTRHLVSGVV